MRRRSGTRWQIARVLAFAPGLPKPELLAAATSATPFGLLEMALVRICSPLSFGFAPSSSSACCSTGRARAHERAARIVENAIGAIPNRTAHAATPGRALAETAPGSRRRPPPPAGARPQAGLAQPAITEATEGQTEARSLPAVPTSVAAAHPKKGPAAAADVHAFLRPAFCVERDHGLRYP